MLPLLLATLIFAYFIYAAHVLDLHRSALEALCKPVADWFGEAGNPVRAALWIGAILLSLASWLSPSTTLFNQMLPDFISISIAVIVIDELVGYRNRLERKQEIFEQVQSRVRDVAVEALRIAVQNGWLSELVQQDKLRAGQFEGAAFPLANLQGAYLSGTNLQKANLWGANLQGAILWSANFQEANLDSANLQGATLHDAKFQGANLSFANLKGNKLFLSNLQGAKLTYANLEKVDLTSANMQDADLMFSHLKKTDFHGADLQRANLMYTNLSMSNLLQANLKGATYNNDTVWPDGFDPVAAGAIKVDD